MLYIYAGNGFKEDCIKNVNGYFNLNKRKNGLIKDELSNLPKYANKLESWEKYFEDLVKRATYSKMYKHSHTSDLRDCYYINCSDCNVNKANKCDGF